MILAVIHIFLTDCVFHDIQGLLKIMPEYKTWLISPGNGDLLKSTVHHRCYEAKEKTSDKYKQYM